MKDGGPAFPRMASPEWEKKNAAMLTSFGQEQYLSPHTGMSLRDYFAAAVLRGSYARYGHGSNDSTALKLVASEAYQVADAMLAEREKERT